MKDHAVPADDLPHDLSYITCGRFGHHPDPATDFCVEVDALIGMAADFEAGLGTRGDLLERIARAMQFQVGGDDRAVAAKSALRELERRCRPPSAAKVGRALVDLLTAGRTVVVSVPVNDSSLTMHQIAGDPSRAPEPYRVRLCGSEQQAFATPEDAVDAFLQGSGSWT